MTNYNGAPDNSLDFDPNADYLKEVQGEGEGAAVEAGGEIPAVDPVLEATTIASVAESTDPAPDLLVEAQIAELNAELGVATTGGETPAEALTADSLASTGLLEVADGLNDTVNTVMEDVVVPSHEADIGDVVASDADAQAYAAIQDQERQARNAAARENYRQQLSSSPRYQELLAKYNKPTVFKEGTNRVKERAPDPTFGRALREDEASNFPGAKIIVFEKDGKEVRYALSRNQHGELQGSQFTLLEKQNDPNSRTSSWVNSSARTDMASESDQFMIGPTYQVHSNDLEEMEALLKAINIEV